jgi:hypothetical protein
MNTSIVKLDLPETIYQLLEKQPLQVREMAIQHAVDAIASYLEQEAKLAAGREMLLRLPQEAQKYADAPPSDLSSNHDDYLYGAK